MEWEDAKSGRTERTVAKDAFWIQHGHDTTKLTLTVVNYTKSAHD